MIKEKIYLLLIVLVSICPPLYSKVKMDASEFADSVMFNDSLANYYGEKGDLMKAQEYALNNVVIINSILGKSSVAYAVAVLKYARYLYPNDRDEDDELSNNGLSIIKDSLGSKSSIYIQYLLEYAWRQYNSNQIQKACYTLKEAVEEEYNNDDYLGRLYYSYAHFFKALKEKDTSMCYLLKAKSFFENKQMCDDDYYMKTLTDLAVLNISNQDLAIKYLNVVQTIILKNKGDNNLDFLDVLLNIAYIYKYNNQLEEALNYAIQAKKTGEKIKQIYFGSYLYTLEFLAGRYSSLKQYDKAIEYAEECLNLMKESKESTLVDRLTTLDSLIVYYSNIPNVEKINLYAKEAYLIRKSRNIGGEGLVKNLYYLLHSNYYLAKYEECESNLKEIKEMYGKNFSSGYKHFYDDMDLLMHSYFNRKLYKEAIEVSNEIEEACKQQYGEENEYLPRFLMNRANVYIYLGEMDEYLKGTHKALEMIKRVCGENSPKYLSSLHSVAISLYNVGFYDQAYDMFKKTAGLANNLFGKMNIFFVTNYLSAMLLWDIDRGDLFDDYNLNDLYRYLLFQKIVCDLNNSERNLAEKMLKGLTDYMNWSFPNLLIKYKNTSSSRNAIYKCLSLSKLNTIDMNLFNNRVCTELGKDSNELFVDFCQTNSAYIKAQNNLEPEQLDSLYKQSTYYIELLSKVSPTFCNYIKGMAVVDSLINNLLENEAIIDFLPRSHLGDGYFDYFVIMDRKKKCPDFVPSTNVVEELKQISDPYQTVYFVFDNDSVMSNFNNNDINAQCIVGYDSSIAHILNREKNEEGDSQDANQQLGRDKTNLFSLAINDFERGVDLYNRKHYKQAIDAFLASDSLIYIIKGNKSSFYGHGMHWIASCYYKMGKDSIAQQYSEYYNLTPIDMRSTILSDSILDVATSIYNNGEIEAALKKYIEASEIEKKNLGRYNYWYANTLSHCADLYEELGEYEKAIEYETEVINIRTKSPGVDNFDYYYSLRKLYDLYSAQDFVEEMGKYRDILVDYMEKHRDLIGDDYLLYPVYTLDIAMTNVNNNHYQKAYDYFLKSIESANVLIDLPFAFMNLHYKAIMGLGIIGKDSLSFELCKKIIPYYEENINSQIDPNELFEILLVAANHYWRMGDYITTSIYQEKALEIAEDKKSLMYGVALSNLALTYSELGRIDESIKLAEEALLMSDSVKYVSEYAFGLMNLAHCYAASDKPKEALQCGKKSYQILINNLGIDNYETLLAANNLAQYYNELGYSEEAKNLLFLVVEHAEKDLQKNGDILGTAYNNLGMGWAREKLDYQTSLEFVNKSYEIRKEFLGANNLLTIESLYNKGRCLLDIGEVSEGISYITKALSLIKNKIGENNLRYVEMMKIMTTIYSNAGDYKRALKMEEERSVQLRRIVGEQHIAFIRSLETLSELLFYIGETNKLNKIIIEESNKYRKMIISDFPNYTSIERTNAVNGMVSFFDWLFPLVCYYKSHPQICSELYNALLLRKGLLLNSEIEFSRLIKESGDSVLIRRYNELIANKIVLNKQYQMPVEHRTFNIDSLKHKINEEENYLVAASKEYGEYTKRLNVSWKDIKDKLNDDELCVEFVVFNDTCSVQGWTYYALLIEKNSESPQFVPLCNETQIQETLRSGEKTGRLYNLIWDPIIRNSSNTKTIYFSPSGILNV